MSERSPIDTLNEAFSLIRRWHRLHNMEPPKLLLVYPNRGDMYTAEMAIKHDDTDLTFSVPTQDWNWRQGIEYKLTAQGPRY